jgi:ferric-dicitrate binding protein FerR (iron transport regulator)
MTRAHPTTPGRRRRREFLGVVGVVVLAAGAGLVASQLGTHRSWEKPTTTSTTQVPSVDPQGNP